MDFVSFIMQFPVWSLLLIAAVIIGVFWMIVTALAAFFIFTGPPDTFDVDIKDSKKDEK